MTKKQKHCPKCSYESEEGLAISGCAYCGCHDTKNPKLCKICRFSIYFLKKKDFNKLEEFVKKNTEKQEAEICSNQSKTIPRDYSSGSSDIGRQRRANKRTK